MANFLLIIGILITILSHSKIIDPLMMRLYNEKIATPKNLKKEDIEIIKYTGPHTTLFIIGIIFIFISFIIRFS